MRLVAILLGASSILAMTAASAMAAEARAGAGAGPPAPGPDQAFTLGQIVVTAPKVQGAAVDATTLTSQAIYAFDRQSLDDAINLIPGVSSSNTGGSRNERIISVRGFNRFEVPLLIDGIRVFLPADNRLDYGRFLTADVAEIQVAKGYASVLDGPDGMGGAINLVTRKPTKEIEMEARGGVTLGRDEEYAGYNAFGLIGTKRDQWYAQASFNRNGVDHTDLSGAFKPTPTEDGGHRDLSQTSDWRANVKFGFTPNATDEYTLNYTKQEGSKLAPLSTTDPLSIQKYWTWPYWDIDSLYFLSTTALGDRFTLKTKAYRNTFDNLLSSFDNRNENTQTLGKAFNSYYADQAFGGSAELESKLTAADSLAVSLQYREDQHVEWQQSFPGGVTEPHQTSIEDTWSLAAENRLALRPDLMLTVGASYDWRDLKQAQDYAAGAFVYYPLHNSSAVNGQARLSWTPQAGQELYASISDRSRFPTLFDRFSSRFGGAVSSPDLKPERAINYEVGGSRNFGALHAEAAVFYSDLTDTIVNFPFIYTTCTPAGVCTANPVTQSRNLGHGDFYGAEFSLNQRLASTLSVGGNYTFIHRDLKDPTNAAFEPTDVPTSKGLIYAEWTPVARLRVMPNLEIADNRWTVNSAGTLYYRTGAYTLVNLTVEYAFTDRFSVNVGGRNLLDRNYQLVDGFPEPGRSLFVGVRATY
jgi:iron complex outermembrane receptor protein